MKLNEFKKAAATAQQDLQLAERKAADLQRNAKAAKSKSEQARSEFKRARKSAKQAKKLAAAAEDHARGTMPDPRKSPEAAGQGLEEARPGEKQRKGQASPLIRRRSLVGALQAGANEAACLCAKDPKARSQPSVTVGCRRWCYAPAGQSYDMTCGAFDPEMSRFCYSIAFDL